MQASLRFDDGSSQCVFTYGVPLTLDRILQLHGIVPTRRSPVNGEPTVGDIAALCRKELADPQLAKKLYDKSIEVEEVQG